MFPDLDQLYDTLKKQFYVSVPFAVPKQTIDEAVESFFSFLQAPEGVKTVIDFNITPNHRRGDIGYKKRDSDDHIYDDSKEFFHFHPIILDRYADFLEKNPLVKDFALKAKPIWEVTYQTVDRILSMLDQKFPGAHSKIFNTNNHHIVLRFLRYDWVKSGKYLAKPHYDAGSFTLAIAENCPGLRIGSGPENLKIVEHEEDRALFMLSSNFGKVMDAPELSPGWHDVVQVDESKIGKPFAWGAVVAFIEADGVEALPRSETHKWYKPEAEGKTIY
jgi:hypothetical protein